MLVQSSAIGEQHLHITPTAILSSEFLMSFVDGLSYQAAFLVRRRSRYKNFQQNVTDGRTKWTIRDSAELAGSTYGQGQRRDKAYKYSVMWGGGVILWCK